MLFKRDCVNCAETISFEVEQAGFDKWKAGELIQRALPTLDVDKREMMISGICKCCWDRMFGDQE